MFFSERVERRRVEQFSSVLIGCSGAVFGDDARSLHSIKRAVFITASDKQFTLINLAEWH